MTAIPPYYYIILYLSNPPGKIISPMKNIKLCVVKLM